MYGNSLFPAGGGRYNSQKKSCHSTLKKSHTVLKHDRISSSVAASGLSSLRSASTSLVQNFSVTGTPHSPVPTEGMGSMCIWEALEEEPMVGNPLFLSHKYN